MTDDLKKENSELRILVRLLNKNATGFHRDSSDYAKILEMWPRLMNKTT